MKPRKHWDTLQSVLESFASIIYSDGEERTILVKIPDGAEKPPVTAHAFIVLMESIAEYNEGGNPNVYRKGLPKEKIKDALYYLSEFGFIAGYDEKLEYPEVFKKTSLLKDSYLTISKYRGNYNMLKPEKYPGLDEKYKISFEYIEKKGGVILEIIHTGVAEDLYMDCYIKGGKGIIEIDKQDSKVRKPSNKSIKARVMRLFKSTALLL